MNKKLPIIGAAISGQAHRSKNPDLLFDDIILERVNRVKKVWEFDLESNALDRITVFATHKCNLFCDYCNGPHIKKVGDEKGLQERKREMVKNDITLQDYKSLIDVAKRKYDVKHVHFTGGEAVLHPDIVGMVEYTTKKGILSSITTNGRASDDLYRDLVNAGLTEIRVSIDAGSEADYDSIVGVRGAFGKVLSTISTITEMRDKEDKDVFLVLNACVGEMNLEKIVAVIKFLIGLGPDDVKLLLIAQEKQYVMSQEAEKYVKDLYKVLEGFSEDRFILLRRKIDDLFDSTVMGMRDEVAQEIAKHCFIPMTERTVDGQHYYPCSIYVRHYGEPLGDIRDSFHEQTEKVINFAYNHDCRKDPICLDYCIGCTKKFNVEANKAVVDMERSIADLSCGVKEWDRIRFDYILKEFSNFRDNYEISPFVIIKPFGMSQKDEIVSMLGSYGLEVVKSLDLNDFAAFSQLLYFSGEGDYERDLVYYKYRAMKKLYNTNVGTVLFLRHGVSFDLVNSVKSLLRKQFASKRMILRMKDESLYSMKMTVIHAPEARDLMRENKVISYFKERADLSFYKKCNKE